MGKFANIQMQETVTNITEGFKKMYSNPYYPFLEKGRTVVTYYSQSKELSVLDEGDRKAYADRGYDSPIKYNKIYNTLLYGGEKLLPQLENGDFGLESGDITMDFTVLPGLVPKANDYFIIDHYNNTFLFKVTHVDIGSPEVEDIYSIKCRYTKNDDDHIESNVVAEYTMIVSNIGTEYNCILEKREYDLLYDMERVTDTLKEYYIDLFFSNRVETLIIENKGELVYDPVLMEFIIRNSLLTHDRLIILSQQLYLERGFTIEYDKTIFRCIEDRDKSRIKRALIDAHMDIINQNMSILSMRQEKYFRALYHKPDAVIPSYMNTMRIVDEKLIDDIDSDKTYPLPDHLENIIVNYMNGRSITEGDIETIKNVEFLKTKRLFYLLPMIIFILNYNINTLVKKPKGGN